jgi:hypothetical protein
MFFFYCHFRMLHYSAHYFIAPTLNHVIVVFVVTVCSGQTKLTLFAIILDHCDHAFKI